MDKELTFPIPCYHVVWNVMILPIRIHFYECEIVGKDAEGYLLLPKKMLWSNEKIAGELATESPYRPLNHRDVYFELATPLKHIQDYLDSDKAHCSAKIWRVEGMLETILRHVKDARARIEAINEIRVPTIQELLNAK